jgi:hypothetical protein
MQGAVAALARKPVRVSFEVSKVEVGVEAGAALSALRDYFERLAREFAKNAKGCAGRGVGRGLMAVICDELGC